MSRITQHGPASPGILEAKCVEREWRNICPQSVLAELDSDSGQGGVEGASQGGIRNFNKPASGHASLETEMLAREPQDTIILVVEDDPMLLEFVHELLGASGYTTLSASNPFQALAFLEDSEQRIDVIFSDIRIPGGMDGIVLARKAKALRPDLKILLTTGYSPELMDGLKEEPFPVIQKPYLPEELARVIRKLLEDKSCNENS